MKKILIRIVGSLLLSIAALPAFAAGGGVHLDHAPDMQGNNAALQSGAKLFVNYCLSCHGASHFRYSKLTEIGLTPDQIKNNLMFTADKIGAPMRVAVRPEEARKWFGVVPPDLTLAARARSSRDGSGADWLYTYLRSFYKDSSRPSGWNNLVFENVGMPHVLWDLQGAQELQVERNSEGQVINKKLVLSAPGKLSPQEYDQQIANLVGFLVWIAEPDASSRRNIGVIVLAFLLVLLVLSYKLKKEFWKDIH